MAPSRSPYGPGPQPTNGRGGRAKSGQAVPILKSLPLTKEEGRVLAGHPPPKPPSRRTGPTDRLPRTGIPGSRAQQQYPIQGNENFSPRSQQNPPPYPPPPHIQLHHRSQHNDSRNGPTVYRPNRGGDLSILRNGPSEEWRTWPEISIRLSGLQLGLHLPDIYKRLREYGQCEFIELFSNDNTGVRDGNARVRMSGVKEPFWNVGKIQFNAGYPARCWLEQPKRSWTIGSPLDSERRFPVKQKFSIKELDFGFMYEEDLMMVMHTCKDSSASFEVDLRTKRIYVFFSISFTATTTDVADAGSNTSSVTGDDDANIKDDTQTTTTRLVTRKYRMEIPFAHLEHFLRSEVEDPLVRTFVIPLAFPPKYSRIVTKREDTMKAVDANDDPPNFWTVNEAWMRQTAIEASMEDLPLQPVSLRIKKPIIDIARWTTLRLTFSLTSDNVEKFDYMLEALYDFNVRTKLAPNLKVSYDSSKLTPIWPHIEQNYDNAQAPENTNDWMAIMMSMNRPVIPWTVQYQLEACVTNEVLNEYNMTPEFIDRLMEVKNKHGEQFVVSLLEHIVDKKIRYFNPMDIFKIRKKDVRVSPLFRKDLADYNAPQRRATVTPTGLIFSNPEVDQTNRVVRQFSRYRDNFIRVNFSDEKNYGRINWTDKRWLNEVFTRVFRTLEHGIVIGDKHFEFLAFGNSQLREHGAWFFCLTGDLTCEDIRQWMGEFRTIKTVAKYAARLGQCFSTTRAVNSCNVECPQQPIPDVENNGYYFTDGVGKMSQFLANRIAWEHQHSVVPSCYQFRLGGYKGVLAVDPKLESHNPNSRFVYLRKSQHKFDSGHQGLEVIRTSQFCTATLNRQLIIVMSALGIEDEVFKSRLANMLSDYSLAMTDKSKALEKLTSHIDPNQMTIELAKMVRAGFMDVREPFMMSLLHLWRAWTSKYLKEKAKIVIEEGAFILGVVDETETLKGYNFDASLNDEAELPEIFLQVSDPASIARLATAENEAEGDEVKKKLIKSIPGKNGNRIIVGKCIVARNPSLHPGDVRVVNAVYVEELSHLVDVVVFPKKGYRDIPSMLSGGDLDGDDYIVIWDPEFTDYLRNAEPAEYHSQKAEEVENVEVHDIISFFVRYMKNDTLGMIANAHLAWADKKPEGVMSPECLELAQLHSDAVDFPKSGVPARMRKKLKTKYPHFMEKEPDKTYKSDRILGQLYDQVMRIDFVPTYDLDFNRDILTRYELTDEYLSQAHQIKVEYDADIRRIMAQHDIETEFEIWSTFVMAHSSGSGDYKFHEEIGRISFALKARFKKRIQELVGEDTNQAKLREFVAAMYAVTAEQVAKAKVQLWEKQNPHAQMSIEDEEAPRLKLTKENVKTLPMMSFPWLFPDVLVRVKNGYETNISGPMMGKAGAKKKKELSEDQQIRVDQLGFEIIDMGTLGTDDLGLGGLGDMLEEMARKEEKKDVDGGVAIHVGEIIMPTKAKPNTVKKKEPEDIEEIVVDELDEGNWNAFFGASASTK